MAIVECVWEHNGNDTLLYAGNYPGAYARGESLLAAQEKMSKEILSFVRWRGERADSELKITVVQDYSCALNIRDADSDVLFNSELNPISAEEYFALKQLALKSAEDFQTLYNSIPNRDVALFPERPTFYGMVPNTANQIYLHTKNVNSYYFGEIGIDANNDGTILACRKNGFSRIENNQLFLCNELFHGSYGEDWTLRKVIRRFLWHDRIHAKALYRSAIKLFGEEIIDNAFLF